MNIIRWGLLPGIYKWERTWQGQSIAGGSIQRLTWRLQINGPCLTLDWHACLPCSSTASTCPRCSVLVLRTLRFSHKGLLWLQMLIVLNKMQARLACVLAHVSFFLKDRIRYYHTHWIEELWLCKQDYTKVWVDVGSIQPARQMQVPSGFSFSALDLHGLCATFYLDDSHSSEVQVAETW